MNCPSCQHVNRDTASFCANCGDPLLRPCPECKSTNRAGARFCDSCGHSLTAEPAAAKFSRGFVEGERRIVTVLFADAVGHTAIAESIGEEAVYDLMQGCFDRMQRAVELFEGTVNQFTGDGVLALFGAPIAHEDSARRAVAASLEMQRSLTAYAGEIRTKHGVECGYRIGLNTGPVVVGRISDHLDLEVTAVGDTVNLASRMQTMAEPGTVCMSENTYREVKEFFDCEVLGAQRIKGKSQSVSMYRPLREKGVRTRFEAATRRGLTPYTGRTREREMLGSYLEMARAGSGQVVLISGEAGIGKSRLLLEFQKSLGAQDIPWFEGQCISFGEHIPYLPVIGMLKSAFGIEEMDSESTIIERIAAASETWSDEVREVLPYARYLLQVDPGDKTIASMDPRERRAGFLDLFRTIVAQSAASSPVIIAVEDLHWIDEQSQEILMRIVDAVAALPALVLLTTRPGYAHPFGDRSYVSRMALTHLREKESAELACKSLGVAGLPGGIRELITTKAEGNPFFIEEVTRSLIETGALVRSNDTITLARDLNSVVIPGSVHEVILSRIDRLEASSREALQLASVIGREFTVRLLNRISDSEGRLDDSLRELKALELIYETGELPELAYMFKHAMTHDVAYSMLLTERRKQLHGTVARAIETLFEDRIAEQVEALAYHYERAEEWDPALAYLTKSGEKAAAAFANAEAIDFYSRAIAICQRLGDAKLPVLARIAEKRAFVFNDLGEYGKAIQDCDLIIEAARRISDSNLEGFTTALRAYFQWSKHDFPGIEPTLERASALADRGGTDVQFAATLVRWLYLNTTARRSEGQPYLAKLKQLYPKVSDKRLLGLWTIECTLNEYWSGNYEAALEIAQSGARYLKGRALDEATTRWVCGMCQCSLGRFGDALDGFHESLAKVQRLGNWFFENRILNSLGWIYNEIEDFEGGRRWNELGLEHTLGAPQIDTEVVSNVRLNLGESLVGLRRFDEAEEQFLAIEDAVRQPKVTDMIGYHNYSTRFYHVMGELRLRDGNTDQALEFAEECLTCAKEYFRAKYVVRALRLRGEARAALGDTAAAVDDIAESVGVAREIAYPVQLWKSLAAYATVLADAGDTTASQRAHAETTDVLQQIANAIDEKQRGIFLASESVKPFIA